MVLSSASHFLFGCRYSRSPDPLALLKLIPWEWFTETLHRLWCQWWWFSLSPFPESALIANGVWAVPVIRVWSPGMKHSKPLSYEKQSLRSMSFILVFVGSIEPVSFTGLWHIAEQPLPSLPRERVRQAVVTLASCWQLQHFRWPVRCSSFRTATCSKQIHVGCPALSVKNCCSPFSLSENGSPF